MDNEKAASATEGAEEQANKTEAKKKKPSKKDAELAALQNELNASKDLLARTAAEFDNYKKRTEREKSGVAEFAKASVIKKLLPIIDNIERANAADKESPDYIKGIEMIVKQFTSITETLCVEEIGKSGDKFDPNFHEAVMHIEDEAFGENEIAEVLQKGYKLGDTIIRPAMVKVAN